ncbi:MAG: LLM class flavin-dependent oxidoreductase [Caulobacteraceae bacterium]|nr:LLM class flavin-dependent oxidoreductase [Caulobacteraceae bacterium]
MDVGVMVTNYNHRDWDRLLAGDYQQPPATPDAAIHRETILLGEMVEPLGFDALWCAEHYGSAYSMQGNPLQWLAYWAGRTKRIGMGTAVIVLPWWQPVKLIHEIAMLDLLLDGRKLHLGIGRGVSAHEYDGFSVPREESRQRFAEMVEILRASEQLRFSHEGKYYKVPDTTVRPMAPHRGHLFDNLKAAFNTPASMEQAAELGLGQMFVTGTTLDEMAVQVAKFNAIRGKKGMPPNQPTTMMYLHCSTDRDELAKGYRYAGEQAWAARNHYAVWNAVDFAGVPGYEDYAQRWRQGKDFVEERMKMAEDGHLIGTPEELIAKIKRTQEKISLEYLIVHPAHGSKPGPEARASLELFAKEVLPEVQKMATPIHEHSLGSEEALAAETSIGGAIG